MIVFEGPDAVGKTTVAGWLRQNWPGWTYINYRTPKVGVEAIEYHSAPLVGARPQLIVDRLHWSELAYGLTYRDKCDYTRHDWRLMELICLSLGAIFVLMSDAPEAIYERWAADKTQDYDVAKLSMLLATYDAIFAQTTKQVAESKCYKVVQQCERATLPSLLQKISLTDYTPTPRLRGIMAAAEGEALYAQHRLPPGIALGSRHAKFAIIGEAPGKPWKMYRLSVPWDVGRSAEYMWRALDTLDAQWQHGYYTNASAFANAEQFADYFAHQVRVDTIVCLGKRATNLAIAATPLLDQRVEVYELEHPAYQQRYAPRTNEAWYADLAEALAKWIKKED